MNGTLGLVLAVLALAAGAVLLAWRLYFQPRQEGARWAHAAELLGLTLEERGPEHDIGLWSSGPTILQQMSGERGGVPVRVSVRKFEVERGGLVGRRRTYTYYYTDVKADLPYPLQLGLSLSPPDWRADGFMGLMSSAAHKVGHPALDHAGYRSRAAKPSTANLLSMIASAKLHDLDPEEYLRDLSASCRTGLTTRYLELAPKYWRATRARLDPAELDLELGWLTIPAPPTDLR